MTSPKNNHEVRVFIGLLNYYSDMWAIQSHLIQSLTKLIPDKVNLRWTDMKKSYVNIKKAVAREALLVYPCFNKQLQIHT